MDEKNVNQIESDNTQSEDNDVQTERTFTQEEVNRIVSERLAKERSRAERSENNADAQRAAELTARENKLICREYLIDNNYPAEMLNCIDTSDPETFKNKAESIYNAICNKTRRAPLPAPLYSDGRQATSPKFVANDYISSDIIGEAFKEAQKHNPRKYPGI